MQYGKNDNGYDNGNGNGNGHLTEAFQTAEHSRSASEGSPPLPPWPHGQWPTVQASPVPPAQEAYPVPEPSTATINTVTPTPPDDAPLPPPLLHTTGTAWPASSDSTPTVMAFSQPISMPGSSRSNKPPEMLDAIPRYMPYRPSSIANVGSRDSRPVTQDLGMWEAGFGPRGNRGTEGNEEKRTSRFSDGRPPFSLFHEICFVMVICLAQLLMFASFAQALAPAQKISTEFANNQQSTHWAWYSAAFALSAGAFALPAIRLGSLFGQKRIFVIGFFWFSIWSVLAGLGPYVERGGANGMVYFCVCRAVQGIGPALVVPNGQALLARAYILGPRRNLVMCLFGASAPAGFVVGAVMASLFAKLMSWEWAYFVLGAVCVTLACQSMIVLPADHTTPKTMGVRYVELLDVPGMILAVSGLALIAFAWNQAPVAGWNTPYIYFLLIIGMLLMAGFLYVESRTKYALLPTAALNITTLFILACTTVGWACFSAWVFYTFQFLIVLRKWSPLLASASFAALPVVGLLASVMVAFLLRRVTPYRVMLIAMAAFLAGSALMAFAPVDQIFWIQTFLSIVLIPIGMNVSTPVAAVLVSNAVPKEHQGIATSLVTAAIFTSVAVSLGIAGTIESYVNESGQDVEKGYRAALWYAMGLAGLGLVLAAVAALADTLWPADPEEGATLHIGRRKAKDRPKRRSLAVGISPSP